MHNLGRVPLFPRLAESVRFVEATPELNNNHHLDHDTYTLAASGCHGHHFPDEKTQAEVAS